MQRPWEIAPIKSSFSKMYFFIFYVLQYRPRSTLPRLWCRYNVISVQFPLDIADGSRRKCQRFINTGCQPLQYRFGVKTTICCRLKLLVRNLRGEVRFPVSVLSLRILDNLFVPSGRTPNCFVCDVLLIVIFSLCQ